MSAVTESLARALKEQEEGLLNCVHCGFCLPACPTYRRLGDEGDSPRGRLHLMRAVVEGRLEAGSDAFQLHIDRCLGCRACEPVCPSGVAYGHLLELARHVGREARRPPLLSRLLLRVFGTRYLARPAMAMARLLRATGIPALLARARPGKGPPGPVRLGMAMLAATATAPVPAPAPIRHARPSTPAPAPADRPGTVAILTGCVQAGLFARVNAATERVLRANGYDVVRVPGQGCCGALHSHAGDLDAARALARRNIEAFEAAEADFIVMNASGCGAAMSAYASLFSGSTTYRSCGPRMDPARAEKFNSRLPTTRPATFCTPRAYPAPPGRCCKPCRVLRSSPSAGRANAAVGPASTDSPSATWEGGSAATRCRASSRPAPTRWSPPIRGA